MIWQKYNPYGFAPFSHIQNFWRKIQIWAIIIGSLLFPLQGITFVVYKLRFWIFWTDTVKLSRRWPSENRILPLLFIISSIYCYPRKRSVKFYRTDKNTIFQQVKTRFNVMILGVPEDRNAFTINKVCSSSLKALILATQVITVKLSRRWN